MIFAKLRLGPEYAPNGHAIVEVLSQIDETPYGRFKIRDLKSGKVFDVQGVQLTLVWWEFARQPEQS